MLAKGQPVPIPAGADDEPFSILADDGTIKPGVRAPEIPDEAALKLYRGMLQVRLVDDRMMKLQRQGRLGFYMSSIGEEATHFGGAYALRDERLDLPVAIASRASASGAATRIKRLRQPAVRQRRGSGQGPADAGAPLGATGSTSSRSRRRSARRFRRRSGMAMGGAASPRRTTCALVYFGEGTTLDGRSSTSGSTSPASSRRRASSSAATTAGRSRRRASKQTAAQVDRHQGARLRHAGRPRRRQRPARGHRGHAGRGRARARRRRADADRGGHLPSRRPLVVGRSVGLSRSGGAQGVGGQGSARALAPLPARRAGCGAEALHEQYSTGDHRRDHGRGQARGRARQRRRSSRCSTTCSPSCRRTCASRRPS